MRFGGQAKWTRTSGKSEARRARVLASTVWLVGFTLGCASETSDHDQLRIERGAEADSGTTDGSLRASNVVPEPEPLCDCGDDGAPLDSRTPTASTPPDTASNADTDATMDSARGGAPPEETSDIEETEIDVSGTLPFDAGLAETPLPSDPGPEEVDVDVLFDAGVPTIDTATDAGGVEPAEEPHPTIVDTDASTPPPAPPVDCRAEGNVCPDDTYCHTVLGTCEVAATLGGHCDDASPLGACAAGKYCSEETFTCGGCGSVFTQGLCPEEQYCHYNGECAPDFAPGFDHVCYGDFMCTSDGYCATTGCESLR